MAITKVRMNSKGVIALLKSTEVQRDLGRRGAAIKAALPTDGGETWAQTDFLGFDRAQTIVGTDNYASKVTAANNFALQRALDAGR